MNVRGWLIVGSGDGLPPRMYCGDRVGSLPEAALYTPGMWMLWRPVAALVAGTSTQVAVVCVEVQLGV